MYVFKFCMCIVSYHYNKSLNICLKKEVLTILLLQFLPFLLDFLKA